jgi:hypothetical protein
MAENDIAFLLNGGELVEPHEIKQNWKVKMRRMTSPFF